MIDLSPIFISLQLSFITIIILLCLAAPCAWWLIQLKAQKSRYIAEPILNFPLIMPPTVLGFYLLMLLGNNGPFGMLNLAFQFNGILVASVIYSFPFVLQPLLVAFEKIPIVMLEFAKVDGISYWRRFFYLALPLSFKGISRAALLGFSHTMGAFGIILIIGGSIEGRTKTASIALWEKIEMGDYLSAHIYAIILIVISIIIFFVLRYWEHTFRVSD